MAMYENLGFCPHRNFRSCDHLPVTHQWEQAAQLLGDRTLFMVYPVDMTEVRLNNGTTVSVNGEHFYHPVCGVVDAIRGASGYLGVQIATVLKLFFPVCVYAETDCTIQCFDLEGDEFSKVVKCDEHGTPTYDKHGKLEHPNPSALSILLQDERYLVLIERDSSDPRYIKVLTHKRVQ